MHSATDWLGYAVWQDGVLLRSLSLSPDGGITEDMAVPSRSISAYQSGARMQARLALRHGRHVFLMRSLLQHNWARGCAERPGVTVVDNAGHVFDGLQRLAAQSAESTELVWA